MEVPRQMNAATKPYEEGTVPTTIALSPGWSGSLPNGPDRRVKITPAYAKHVASDAYFWAWPMLNFTIGGSTSPRFPSRGWSGPCRKGP